ncbi:MAG: hypothetical protein CMM56_09695 [Rhodospirillaceae bacterium]|nr:hypothetical protein [Rhodospirillaceae bacterium]
MLKLNKLFRGPWWHWVILAGVFLILGILGSSALHVREFNFFLILLIFMSFCMVLLVGLSKTR